MEVGFTGAFVTSGSGEHQMIVSPPADPFPIIFTIRFPVTVTIPIIGFKITFPSWVNLTQGTFDVDLLDEAQGISYTAPLNPTPLGKATASGQTLTFVPAVQTFTFTGGVKYQETIARDLGGAGVILPLGTGVQNQLLPPNGTLDSPNINTNSSGSTNVQYTVEPNGAVFSFGDPTAVEGIESIILKSTGSTQLTNTAFTMGFNTTGGTPLAGPNFTPGTTTLGPYPANCTGPAGDPSCTFTVTDSIALSAGTQYIFSLFTVDVCVPINSDGFAPCDSTNPNNAYGITQGNPSLQFLHPNTQYDVYVSDPSDSGQLGGSLYSIAVSSSNPTGGPLTGGTGCTGVAEGAGNSDIPPSPPYPVYIDWGDQVNPDPKVAGGTLITGLEGGLPGPNGEFEIFTGSASPAACTFIISYNGNPVASENIGIGAGVTPMAMHRIMHRLFVNPPINGPHGAGKPGTGAP